MRATGSREVSKTENLSRQRQQLKKADNESSRGWEGIRGVQKLKPILPFRVREDLHPLIRANQLKER